MLKYFSKLLSMQTVSTGERNEKNQKFMLTDTECEIQLKFHLHFCPQFSDPKNSITFALFLASSQNDCNPQSIIFAHNLSLSFFFTCLFLFLPWKCQNILIICFILISKVKDHFPATFSNSRNPFHRRMAPKDSDPKKLLVEAAPSLHFHEDSQAIVSSFYNNPVYLHNYNMQSFPYH